MASPVNPANRTAGKAPPNVYTVMLIISFLALVTACALLATELNRFGSYPWWNTTGGS
jgi:hypothetical protein